MPVQFLHMVEPSEFPAQSLRGGGVGWHERICSGVLGCEHGEAGVITTGLGRVAACGAVGCVGGGGSGQGGDCSMSSGHKVKAGGRRVAGLIVEAGC